MKRRWPHRLALPCLHSEGLNMDDITALYDIAFVIIVWAGVEMTEGEKQIYCKR